MLACRSMIGLSANPGTAVLPMCSISRTRWPSAARSGVASSLAWAGQAESYGTTCDTLVEGRSGLRLRGHGFDPRNNAVLWPWEIPRIFAPRPYVVRPEPCRRPGIGLRPWLLWPRAPSPGRAANRQRSSAEVRSNRRLLLPHIEPVLEQTTFFPRFRVVPSWLGTADGSSCVLGR
jgi:hypothetical protein